MASLLSFPNPVNETAARVVAAGVAVMAWTMVITDARWLVAVLAYGFVARVATGPRLSPLGQLATRVVAPRLPSRLVPGPPKRFAQGIGAALSLSALVALLVGRPGVATALVAAIGVAATLESVLALCLGCQIFAVLMRIGLVPDHVCAACTDLTLRRA